MEKSFTFKQVHMNAHECGMPVSTDAVFLVAWANIVESRNILDIGCGTGLLSLMCAQRNELAEITSVEIETFAYQAALENFRNSLWDKRLQLIHTDIKAFTELAFNNKQTYDSIICNPPYFNEGEEAKNKQRAVARHTASLSHSSLLDYCDTLLVDKGKAHFVLPKREGDAFINLLSTSTIPTRTLTLTKLTEVKTTENKPVSRLLIELTKQQKQTEVVRNKLTIRNGEDYSQEFINLTHDFYLKM